VLGNGLLNTVPLGCRDLVGSVLALQQSYAAVLYSPSLLLRKSTSLVIGSNFLKYFNTVNKKYLEY
jgi:hypothetical protein